MSQAPILIKRYPNRRYYSKNASKYVSLQEIEELVQAGETVEIQDSQSGDDLTGAVLAQIIMERHPDKVSLFPTDMLHFILRSNDVMSGFLRDYFRHSLTYLDYLQKHGATTTALLQPMHWAKAWFEGLSSPSELPAETGPASEAEPLAERVQQLEERLEQLESQDR